MIGFAGTTQKCDVCEKTVYLVDKLVANQHVYHKACFRCHHCNRTLKVCNISIFFFHKQWYVSFIYTSFSFSNLRIKFWISLPIMVTIFLQLSNFNSFDGVVYCRPHFDQLFKRTGSLENFFEGLIINIVFHINVSNNIKL